MRGTSGDELGHSWGALKVGVVQIGGEGECWRTEPLVSARPGSADRSPVGQLGEAKQKDDGGWGSGRVAAEALVVLLQGAALFTPVLCHGC